MCNPLKKLDNLFVTSNIKLVLSNEGYYHFERQTFFGRRWIIDLNPVDGCLGGMYQWRDTRYFESVEEAVKFASVKTIEYQNWITSNCKHI